MHLVMKRGGLFSALFEAVAISVPSKGGEPTEDLDVLDATCVAGQIDEAKVEP